MKKKFAAIICLVILFICAIGAWFYGYYHRKSNDNMPSLDAIAVMDEEIIVYNDREYKKSELCKDTLYWLSLTEQERKFSSYMPPEFLIIDENWGVALTVENVTSSGAVIHCTQSDGEATGDLQTGSWYILENWTQENGWKEVPRVNPDMELVWTQEAWIIPKDDTCNWELNWEFLYGKLPVGKYRVGKEIIDFRGTGDFDKAIYFAEFHIEP